MADQEKDWWVGDQAIENVDTSKLNIIPSIPVPVPESIQLRINIGCTSRVRQTTETFQPTLTYTAPFLYTTDLLNYTTLLPTISTTVWNYFSAERTSGAIVETHIQIWIDNVTHPWTGAGVVRLPKYSRDTQLSNEEFTSSQVLLDHLTGGITDAINTTRYNRTGVSLLHG